MVNLHPSLEIVYAVTKRIPAPIDAQPGDEIILRPSDPDFPMVVRRTLPLELAALISTNAVRMLHAAPAHGVRVAVAHHLPAAARARGKLRRVV